MFNTPAAPAAAPMRTDPSATVAPSLTVVTESSPTEPTVSVPVLPAVVPMSRYCGAQLPERTASGASPICARSDAPGTVPPSQFPSVSTFPPSFAAPVHAMSALTTIGKVAIVATTKKTFGSVFMWMAPFGVLIEG